MSFAAHARSPKPNKPCQNAWRRPGAYFQARKPRRFDALDVDTLCRSDGWALGSHCQISSDVLRCLVGFNIDATADLAPSNSRRKTNPAASLKSPPSIRSCFSVTNSAAASKNSGGSSPPELTRRSAEPASESSWPQRAYRPEIDLERTALPPRHTCSILDAPLTSFHDRR